MSGLVENARKRANGVSGKSVKSAHPLRGAEPDEPSNFAALQAKVSELQLALNTALAEKKDATDEVRATRLDLLKRCFSATGRPFNEHEIAPFLEMKTEQFTASLGLMGSSEPVRKNKLVENATLRSRRGT